MPSPYYLKIGAGGSDSGTIANPFLSFGSAVAGATTAGDIVYCSGTDVIATTEAMAYSGTEVSPIIYIGTDASYSETGTDYFTIDGNSAAQYCVDSNSKAGVEFRNFKFTGATSHGINFINCPYHRFYNCEFYNNGGSGAQFSTNNYAHVYLCKFYNNTQSGVIIYTGVTDFLSCLFYGNNLYGFYHVSGTSHLFNCMAWDNTNHGFYMTNNSILTNSISDDNGGDGINTNGRIANFRNLASNNAAYGFQCRSTTKVDFASMNAHYSNVTAGVNDLTRFWIGSPFITVSSDPYTNQAGRNYTQTSTNDNVGVEIVLNALNSDYQTAGINPEYAAGGGGRQPRLRIHGA